MSAQLDMMDNGMEWREHLRLMMSKERLSGDFLLASVVQDSLTYNLNHHAESEALLELAHVAAEVAVETASKEMQFNPFAVSESIRGVMHTMMTLGGDPVLVAVAISTGALAGIRASVPETEEESYKRVIVSGLGSAASDMGLNELQIRNVAEHVVTHATGISFMMN